MEEVYVVISDWANYGEQDSYCVGVFYSIKSAQACMKKTIEENHDNRCDKIETGPMFYCEYIDGEYCDNHYTITIYQKEIQ